MSKQDYDLLLKKYEALFQETLAHVRTVLPLGATNDPVGMEVWKKYYSVFVSKILPEDTKFTDSRPKIFVDQARQAIQAHRTKVKATAQEMELQLTAEEKSKLPAVIAKSLADRYLSILQPFISHQPPLLARKYAFEFHALFQVGNCGIQSNAALLFLMRRNHFPLALYQFNKKKSQPIYGMIDPEDGHTVVVVETCVVMDMSREMLYPFALWRDFLPPGFKGKCKGDPKAFLTLNVWPENFDEKLIVDQQAAQQKVRELVEEIQGYFKITLVQEAKAKAFGDNELGQLGAGDNTHHNVSTLSLSVDSASALFSKPKEQESPAKTLGKESVELATELSTEVTEVGASRSASFLQNMRQPAKQPAKRHLHGDSVGAGADRTFTDVCTPRK